MTISRCGVYQHQQRQKQLQTQSALPEIDFNRFERRVEMRRKSKLQVIQESEKKKEAEVDLRQFAKTSPVTLTTFLVQEQQRFKEASGEFTNLVIQLQTLFKSIRSK